MVTFEAVRGQTLRAARGHPCRAALTAAGRAVPTDFQSPESEGKGRTPEPVHEAQPRYTSGEADPSGISPEHDSSRNAVLFVRGNPPDKTRHTWGYYPLSDTPTRGRARAAAPRPTLLPLMPRHPPESDSRSLTFPLSHIRTVQLGFFMLSFCHLDSNCSADGPELPIQRANPCLSGIPVSKENTLFFG